MHRKVAGEGGGMSKGLAVARIGFRARLHLEYTPFLWNFSGIVLLGVVGLPPGMGFAWKPCIEVLFGDKHTRIEGDL